MLKEIRLFDGALTTELPLSFIDISTVRQVPDSQEVYAESDGTVTWIIEILEPSTENGEYAQLPKYLLSKWISSILISFRRYHLEQLAIDNEATVNRILSAERISVTSLSYQFRYGGDILNCIGKNAFLLLLYRQFASLILLLRIWL
jgi:hypothetical protein